MNQPFTTGLLILKSIFFCVVSLYKISSNHVLQAYILLLKKKKESTFEHIKSNLQCLI